MIESPPVKLKRALRKTRLKGIWEVKVVPVVVNAATPSKNESMKFKEPDSRKGSPPIKDREIHNAVMNKKPSLILK